MAQAISNLRAPTSVIREAESLFDVARVMRRAASTVIPAEPAHKVWLAATKRTLLFVRVVTMMRSCDAAGILRSSIRKVKHPWGDRELVVFHYVPKGKGAAQARAHKQAIIEFMPQSMTGLCAARAILDYKSRVDSVVGDTHNALFVASKRPHSPLSRDRLRTIVDETLESMGLSATAHSLRLMSRDKLVKFHDEHGEVDGALWANASVAVRHYQSGFRRPEVNFSLALATPFEQLTRTRQRFNNIFEKSILQTLADDRSERRQVIIGDSDSDSVS